MNPDVDVRVTQAEEVSAETTTPKLDTVQLPTRKLTDLPNAVEDYEQRLDARIRDKAPRYIAQKDKAVAVATSCKEIKDRLAFDLALKKALLLGNGGRDSEWGPYVESLGLVIRTVDRWVEKKIDDAALPYWASERLRANQKPESESDHKPEKVGYQIGFNGTRMECIFAFTNDETTELKKHLRLLSLSEVQQAFLQAVRSLAEEKRKQPLDKSLSFTDEEEVELAGTPNSIGAEALNALIDARRQESGAAA